MAEVRWLDRGDTPGDFELLETDRVEDDINVVSHLATSLVTFTSRHVNP
jgi:hypothetical protein